jgi:hypothetical protein
MSDDGAMNILNDEYININYYMKFQGTLIISLSTAVHLYCQKSKKLSMLIICQYKDFGYAIQWN